MQVATQGRAACVQGLGVGVGTAGLSGLTDCERSFPNELGLCLAGQWWVTLIGDDPG